MRVAQAVETEQIHVSDACFLFAAICAAYIGLTFVANEFVLTEGLYRRSIPLPDEQMDMLLVLKQKWALASYLLFPALLILKVGYTTICVATGAILAEQDVKFSPIFAAALVGEIVFVIATALRVGAAVWGVEVGTLQEYAGLYTLSMLDLLGTASIEPWLFAALRSISLYECMYVLVLALVLSRFWKDGLTRTLAIVAASYGVGFALWLTVLTFLSLQAS